MSSDKQRKIKSSAASHVIRVLRAVRCNNFRVPSQLKKEAFMKAFRLVGK